MSRAALFLGAAGAGKSTLINSFHDTHVVTTVSDDMWADGTRGIQVLPSKAIPLLFFMDTPGLDSRNVSSEVIEKVQNGHGEKPIAIVLVLERNRGRVTKFMDNFTEIKRALVGEDVPICIVWTKEGPVSQTNLTSTRNRFPSAAIFEDTDLEGLVNYFTDLSNFKTQKATKAKAKAKAALVPQTQPVGKVSSTASVATPRAPLPHRGPPIGLPMFLDSLAGYGLRPTPPLDFQVVVKELLAIKALGGVEYQALCCCGDATLEFTVLSTLRANNVLVDLRTKAERITRNDGVMPAFFAKHVCTLHQAQFPNEEVGEHGEADVVEALLEYARSKRGQGHWVFKYIIVELFKLAEMGDLVNPK